MTQDLDSGMICILDSREQTVGAGFLVTERFAVTCAHVVIAAGSAPDGDILLAFRKTGEKLRATVLTEGWLAPEAEDVAVLQLGEAPLADIRPQLLGSSGGTSGHPFKTFGFPSVKPEEGMWGYGQIGGGTTERGFRVIQLTGATEVTRGFSGAPVLDTLTRRVVGMITTITSPDLFGRMTGSAFFIPSETLRDVCPELRLSDICPYRSLDAFSEADAEFFFGRRDLVDRLLEHLRHKPRFLAVLGPSGCGKSSLVQAGLVPQLSLGKVPGSDRWGVIVTRPGEQPFEQLAAQGLAEDCENLAAAVQLWLSETPNHSRLLVVIDQFEELLTITPELLGAEFVAQLAALLDSPVPISLVMTLRDDFYSSLVRQAPAFLPWLESGLVNVPLAINNEELLEIITAPAGILGLSFETDLPQKILNDVLAANPNHSEGSSTILPLLEFALTQLWERRQDGLMTYEAYQAIGGVTGSLAQWADRAYLSLDVNQRLLARRILTDLVHLGDESRGLPDSRQRRTLGSLCRSSLERDDVYRVVQSLANARLLVTTTETGSAQETVELIHEALVQEWGLLADWVQENRRFLFWRQKIEERVSAWVESNPDAPSQRDVGRLLRTVDLAEAERWMNEHRMELTQAELDYIEASQKRRQEEEDAKRKAAAQMRWRAIFLAGALVVAIIVSLYASSLAITNVNLANANATSAINSARAAGTAQAASTQAIAQWRIAQSRKLSLQAQYFLAKYPDLALLLGIEALKAAEALPAEDQQAKSTLMHARSALFQTVQSYPSFEDGLFAESLPIKFLPLNSLAFSPDGKILAAACIDKMIKLWDLDDPRRPVLLNKSLSGHTGAVYSVAFSPDSRILASASDDHNILLWDMSDPRQPARLGEPLNGHTGTVVSVVFSPDGKTLASGSHDNSIILWDLSDSTRPAMLGKPLAGYKERVSSVAFSPDGQWLAAASGGVVLIWDVNDPHQPEAVGEPLSVHLFYAHSVAFSPDSKTLAVGGMDAHIMGATWLWDLNDPHHPVRIEEPLGGHTQGMVNSVAFNPDGETLASAGADKYLLLWDVSDPKQPFQLGQFVPDLNDDVLGIAFRPDGKILAAVGLDGITRLWDTSMDAWLYSACQRAGRNLTLAEWTQYIGNEPYQKTCPQWPEGE